jgi:hypothetical protein
MGNEAFVYEWFNLTNGKSYIGYHKGSKDDGYISSSHNQDFWNDFNNSDMMWERKILSEGTKDACLQIEQRLLKEINLRNNRYYNNARGAEIIFTKDVLDKMSNSHKKRWEIMSDEKKIERAKKISESKKGVPCSEETKKKLSELLKGKTFIERFGKDKAKEIGNKISEINTGKHYHSEYHKQNLRKKLMGNSYGKNQSEDTKEKKRTKWLNDNPGKNPTDETRKKMSESRKGIPSLNKGVPRKKVTCPYCGKEGGEGLMHRWHFENCKNK